jgi:hypothetical protein
VGWKFARGYCSNELVSVMSRERKLCSRSRMSDQFIVSVYRVYFVNIGIIFMWIYET